MCEGKVLTTRLQQLVGSTRIEGQCFRNGQEPGSWQVRLQRGIISSVATATVPI